MSGASPRAEASGTPAVSVLIPVYRSGDQAAEAVGRILGVLEGVERVEVILCDDGSPDDSLAQIESLRSGSAAAPIRVLSHPNRGLGFTLTRLIREARGEACVYLDMDLSFDVSRLPRLLELLSDHDIVVASRYSGATPSGVPAGRRICSRAYRGLVFLLTGTDIVDIGSGMVAFRRERVRALGLASEGFNIHAELFDKARRAGLAIRVEPVPYVHAPGSFRPLRHGALVVRDLVLYRLNR